MKHLTLPRFWVHYWHLPQNVRKLADKNYRLLKLDPAHPSLHFKKVRKNKLLWSVRVGRNYRALGKEVQQGILWFWIGDHAENDKLLKA